MTKTKKEDDSLKLWGIAYIEDGSSNKILSWKRDDLGNDQTWTDRNIALEACDHDGWRGYVCSYPDGGRLNNPPLRKA